MNHMKRLKAGVLTLALTAMLPAAAAATAGCPWRADVSCLLSASNRNVSGYTVLTHKDRWATLHAQCHSSGGYACPSMPCTSADCPNPYCPNYTAPSTDASDVYSSDAYSSGSYHHPEPGHWGGGRHGRHHGC
ncbi:hypothetical protein D1159_02425 [Pseudoflavonifractor sp. 524-17]|uniref:hypothetical protein n=1 Tax=Pseudoflavonifractor sp. 524-17 TaxID=2304577 RepID=UPI00137A04E2|nr:hypothetical protein [Pseudoflavonifractor sp. 524-17]NCE63463.1 hypothetical protein [Pseudoflavonifractor sp. 524-17]